MGTPCLYLGIGVKLPVGEHDRFDQGKYAFDRSKAITGEASVSDGIVPATLQLGSGTIDVMPGAFGQIRLWRFSVSGGVTALISGGANSVGYERGLNLSWSMGLRLVLYRSDQGLKVQIRGALSGIVLFSNDIDHSENTALLGRQEKGEVAGTDKDYTFWEAGADADVSSSVTASVSLRFALGRSAGASESSFKRQVNFTVSFKF